MSKPANEDKTSQETAKIKIVERARWMTDDDNDFELPVACPLRNNGDETCESCQ